MESVDLKTKVNMVGEEEEDSSSSCGSRRSHRRSCSSGDIPPPISPVVLRRYYTDDGRLVIRGERMKGREYFHADRSDGRLTLRLVPIQDESDDDYEESDDDDENCFESFDKESDLAAGESCIVAAVHGGDDDREFREKAAGELTVGIPGGGGGGGHLYQYCGMSRSPYLLGGGGMASPAIRSVHT